MWRQVTSYSSVQQLSDNLSHDVKLEVVPQPAILTLNLYSSGGHRILVRSRSRERTGA